MLVCQPVNAAGEKAGAIVVAADAVGAGVGEMILYATGSSARQTIATQNRPVDAVVMAIVAALARMPGRLIAMTALVAGLTAVQVVIAVLAKAFDDTGDTSTTAGTTVFGLHAINGLVILAVAMSVARRARALSRSAMAVQPAGAAEPTS